MSQALVTWEFLEARNEELCAKLRLPIKPFALEVDPEENLLAIERGLIPLNPVIIAALDEGEATHLVASALLNRKVYDAMVPLRRRYRWLMKPKNRKYLKVFPWVLRAFMLPLEAAFAFMIAGNFGLVFWLIFGVFAVLQFSMDLFHRPDTARFKRVMTEHLHRQFRAVIAVTGNPAAGERFMRKVCVLRQTDYGNKPMTPDGLRKARDSYAMNVPPEYQVPNAI